MKKQIDNNQRNVDKSTGRSNPLETMVIPLTLVIDVINNLHLGRSYCSICESYDRECGCTINVNERYRNHLIGYLTENGIT